jgi:hypothetical protein
MEQLGTAERVATRHANCVGNRWVLVGGVVYLLEWVAILGTGLDTVVTRGLSESDLAGSYGGHVDAAAFMAGWFALVLLGRILVFVGLRRALLDSGHHHALLDLAVVAAAVSVTLEIAAYGLAVAAAETLESGDRAGMLLLDRAGMGLNLMITGGLGVAIVCSAYVMTRSGLFPRALNIVGWVCGVAIVGAQLSVPQSWQGVFDSLSFFVLVFWVWMIWTGVWLWRRTPSGTGSVTVDA